MALCPRLIVAARAGRPAAGYIIPKYVNADARFRDKNFLRGYYLAGDGQQELYGHAFGMQGFGKEFRRKVSQEFPITSASTRRASACRDMATS